MSDPFRVLFVGVDHPHGSGWRDLLPQAHVEVAAIVPEFGGQITSLEERYADLPRFETVGAALEQIALDGAIVCLPNDRSPRVVQQLAAADKHVLLEKPGAADANSAQAMLAALQSSKGCFQSGYLWRYDEGANRLRQMVADGRFGKLVSLEMTFVTSDVRRRGREHYVFDAEASGTGFFNWLACHFLDLLLYVTRQSIVAVTSRVGVFGATEVEVEDGGVAILELSGGGIATFSGGYWLPRWAGESRWSVRGSERWVEWQPGQRRLEIHGPQPQWYATEEVYTYTVDDVVGYGGRPGLELVRDWVATARRGSGVCRNTPKTHLATLELLDVIYLSSREGRRIECEISPCED